MTGPAEHPRATVMSIGSECQPVVVIDAFSPDPAALRRAAIDATFGSATHLYPGVRAPLPPTYLPQLMPLLADCIDATFDVPGELAVLDASFSIVSTPRADLALGQCLPHCDAYDPRRFAFVHYLALDDHDGTAFYRHRSTGFETIDQTRAPIFAGQLDAELRYRAPLAVDYPSDGGPLFDRTETIEGQFNRVVLYRSFMLHSGAISREAKLLADPVEGRLTVTGFLTVCKEDA